MVLKRVLLDILAAVDYGDFAALVLQCLQTSIGNDVTAYEWLISYLTGRR